MKKDIALKWNTRKPRKNELNIINCGDGEVLYENVFITIDDTGDVWIDTYEHGYGWSSDHDPSRKGEVVGWLPRDVLPPMPETK